MNNQDSSGVPIRAFNPNEHLIHLKAGQTTQDYLPVQWRLVWFRALCPEGTIETEMLHLDLDRETEEEGWAYNAETRRNERITRRANGYVVFKATVKDGRGGVATGTKSEKAASFPDFIEKAETGAIGRALAALGYGTQFAPELDEAHRIVDAPVERPTAPTPALPQTQTPAKDTLDELVKRAKKRALQLGIATDLAGWKKLLADLQIEQLSPATVDKINKFLDKVEAGTSSRAS